MMRLSALFLMLTLGLCFNIHAGKTKGWTQDKFIITMWCPPPSNDANLKILSRDGYTLTMIQSSKENYDPIPALDRVQKYGLKALVYIRPLQNKKTLDDKNKTAKLIALIDKVKKHPAFYGYFLLDEPGTNKFGWLKKLSDFIRQRDSNHLIYINLYPTYANQKQLAVFLKKPAPKNVGIPDNFAGEGASEQTVVFYQEYLRQFIKMLRPQLISYDHYHFLKDGKDGKQYFLNLALIRTAALNAGLPFLNIVQSCTIEKSWRLVNADEVRWLAYTTLAYGGCGLSWFLYWGPTKPHGGLYQDGRRMPLADDVAKVNHEINALGPELMKLTSTGVYHSKPLPLGTCGMEKSPVKVTGGEFIVGTFKSQNSNKAFMVINRNYKKNGTAKISVDIGNGKLMMFSIQTGKWNKVALSGTDDFLVALRPGAGRLFKVIK